jgi:hypothetical protein
MTSPKNTVSSPLCICRDPNCDIPYGLCHCRCGGKTNIATRSKAGRGHIKGMPIRYILQHHAKDPYAVTPDFENVFGVARGYCWCNCGGKTEISNHGCTKEGYVIGEPKRFILGHNICVPNEYVTLPTLDGGDITLIFITGMRSGAMVIETSDLPLMTPIRWWMDEHGYATGKWNGKAIRAHQLLTGYAKGIEVDHKNRVRLDDRRENLRPATRQQNCTNADRRAHNKSGFRGVFEGEPGKYRVSISVNGKRINLGTFNEKVRAALTYDEAARKYHGEFAVLNFPKSD